jgi:class 3 adenylate cyclase
MKEMIIIKESHYDILGYSTNIAVKITELANINGIVIGQSVYNALDYKKSSFKLLIQVFGKYIDDRTKTIYCVYHSSNSHILL